MSFNSGATVTLRGRVATHPITKVTAQGKDMTRFRVVSTRRFKDADDTWTDGEEFGVWVVAWNGLGSAADQHLRLGDAVVVEGTVGTRTYERDGQPDWITEVRASLIALDVQWLRGRIDRRTAGGGADRAADEAASTGSEADLEDGGASVGLDDLPPWDELEPEPVG